MIAKLNKRERRAQRLLAHYATCERLAAYLGSRITDGKKISVALFKIERDAHYAATAQGNGKAHAGQPYREEPAWEDFCKSIPERVALAFGRSPRREHAPPGFFYNTDPRGYALKIDPDDAEGKKLIEDVRLHTDWGGNGILSPEINGEA